MNIPSTFVIAIDGPAGAGKSTVTKLLAKRTGLAILDTGAMYRALAFITLEKGISDSDEVQLSAKAAEIQIEFLPGDPQNVMANGQNVTSAIRSLEMGQRASTISVLPGVRKALVAKQQAIVASGGLILEGRDVTTVVAPHADLKIFLTASIEERARRRWLESQAKGDPSSLQDVVRDVVERDHRDYTRIDSPLSLAADATIVESFGLTIEQVVDHLISLVEASVRASNGVPS